MTRLLRLPWREAVPRMVADYLIVHFSMIAALAISVMYQSAVGNGAEAQAIAGGFVHYYTGFFWLLSPIFTMVFLCSGFYTHSRSYVGPYKSVVIVRSVLIAVMLFFGANFLLFGRERVGRSVALPFAILAAFSVSAARLLKDALQKAYRSEE